VRRKLYLNGGGAGFETRDSWNGRRDRSMLGGKWVWRENPKESVLVFLRGFEVI